MNPYDEQLARWSRMALSGEYVHVVGEARYYSAHLIEWTRGERAWHDRWEPLKIRPIPEEEQLDERDLWVTWRGMDLKENLNHAHAAGFKQL